MVKDGSIVKYGSHELQTIKYFHFNPENTRSIIFVHGGAWRDPNNTYDDFLELTNKIATKVTSLNLIGINYRLLPEVRHPVHIQDVVLALDRIYKDTPTELILFVGHSAGATLILQLLNLSLIKDSSEANSSISDDLTLPVGLTTALHNFYFVDGIYDIPELVKEYPDYESFVSDAFSCQTHYRNVTQLDIENFNAFEFQPRGVIIVQSKQDELLSSRQSNLFAEFLSKHALEFTLYKEDWGTHEEVYRRSELASIIVENES